MLQAMEWLCHKRKGQQQKQTEISPWGLTASCTSGPQDSAQCHLESPGLPVADPPPPPPTSLRPQEPQGPLRSSLLSPRQLCITPLLTTSAQDPGSALLSPPVLAERGSQPSHWLLCGPFSSVVPQSQGPRIWPQPFHVPGPWAQLAPLTTIISFYLWSISKAHPMGLTLLHSDARASPRHRARSAYPQSGTRQLPAQADSRHECPHMPLIPSLFE